MFVPWNWIGVNGEVSREWKMFKPPSSYSTDNSKIAILLHSCAENSICGVCFVLVCTSSLFFWCLIWEGGQGGGDTGIRGGGRGTGVKGAGTGEERAGDGDRGGGGREILGAGVYQNSLYFIDFYVLQCNRWVAKVSNRRIKVNSGIFTMNPELISLHRRGVFRQPWFTLNSFTSDFGSSLVDYFPLIPKVRRWQSIFLEIIIRLP